MAKIVIIDYGVGNLLSIHNMFKKIGVESVISGKQEDIKLASRILLPGMGAFDNCMKRFNDSGLRNEIERRIFYDKVPVLGICVGLQMFMRSSEEGSLPGLGWISGETVLFKKESMCNAEKIPNIGWLDINFRKPTPLAYNLEQSRFYFAHSYHVILDSPEDELISTSYGYDFIAGVHHDNLVGVQFHPEKSHRFGMQFFKNFAS